MPTSRRVSGVPDQGATPIANEEMAAAWDGAEGEHWADHAERYEAASARFSDHLLRTLGVGRDERVLDIGCGTGRAARAVARTATAGSVLGVDLSSSMLERARSAARAEGLDNVRFEQADAQVHRFPQAAFDRALSSFGVMFFSDPVAAFTNIRRSLRGGGHLAFLAWRELSRNAWVAALRDALALGRDIPAPPPGAPGPFGLADPGHTERILTEAGFVEISFRELDEPVRLGADADDTYSFLSTSGIVRGLTQDLDESGKAAALDALRRTLAEHETDEGVLLDGAAWLVTARAP